jgi:glutathione peroxidase|tara:strand:+ start:2075 stop:2554 length:480 start_codon:yes stop_codon:yes gene_type:complete
METIYNFSVKDAELTDISLKKYENKIILIVNVASFCGLTYQYKGLENIYKKYKDEGFEIIGFPCNQFAFQEPGSNQEIKEFCDTNYGVTFEIMNKIKVNGPKADPLFKFLKKQRSGIAGTPQIKWNFTKFLINRDGEVIKRFGPKIEAKDIESTIQKIL